MSGFAFGTDRIFAWRGSTALSTGVVPVPNDALYHVANGDIAAGPLVHVSGGSTASAPLVHV